MASNAPVLDNVISLNELRFHYREWGASDAPCVLLLHGLTGNAWEWDPIAATLADQFQVVALNQRGHGASAWASDYAPSRMVEDIAALIRELQLRHVRIVGHSMGGLNGYLFAAQHPAQIERLVIVDIGPDSLTGEAPIDIQGMAEAAYTDPEEAFREWHEADPRAREPELRHFITHNLRQEADGRWRWRFDAWHLQGWIDAAPDPATQWATLRNVTCPTLVIHGTESAILSRATAQHMVQALPNGRLVEFPESGHDLTVQQPSQLAATVQAFLTEA